jgi:hypothetical protein
MSSEIDPSSKNKQNIEENQKLLLLVHPIHQQNSQTSTHKSSIHVQDMKANLPEIVHLRTKMRPVDMSSFNVHHTSATMRSLPSTTRTLSMT